METEVKEFDFDAVYTVEGWRGIAWHAWHHEKFRDEDFEWSGIEYEIMDRVVCTMVGDDRPFTFGIDELTKLKEDEYCPGCGQVGCKAHQWQ